MHFCTAKCFGVSQARWVLFALLLSSDCHPECKDILFSSRSMRQKWLQKFETSFSTCAITKLLHTVMANYKNSLQKFRLQTIMTTIISRHLSHRDQFHTDYWSIVNTTNLIYYYTSNGTSNGTAQFNGNRWNKPGIIGSLYKRHLQFPLQHSRGTPCLNTSTSVSPSYFQGLNQAHATFGANNYQSICIPSLVPSFSFWSLCFNRVLILYFLMNSIVIWICLANRLSFWFTWDVPVYRPCLCLLFQIIVFNKISTYSMDPVSVDASLPSPSQMV